MSDNMLGNALRQYAGLREQVDENLIGKNGEAWASELKKFLRKEPCWVKNKSRDGLTLLSDGESLFIDACDGGFVLTQTKKMFMSRLETDTVEVPFDKRRIKTEETFVEVYEVTSDSDFKKMFTSVSPRLGILHFTQDQIIKFLEKYPNWLCSSGANLFLFEAFDKFFIAVVRVEEDGLSVAFREFGDEDVWESRCKHRLITPAEFPARL